MKNILFCITGLTPQIVSESLYCLSVQKKIQIDEIIIITTTKGKNVILGKDKDKFTPKVSLKSEIENLCKKYKIIKPIFEENSKHIIVAQEETAELFDIRSDKQNKLFPNKLAKIIKEKTEDINTVLHCVLSGGRKSMTAHLALVLSLFGREHDKLYHVLTSEKFEFKGFYPITSEEKNALEISEIPFIRLRALLGDKLFSNDNYTDFVEWAQNQVKIIFGNNIILNINSKEIRYGNKVIKLTPLYFSIYHYFALSNCEGEKFVNINTIKDKKFSLAIKNFITEYYPYYNINDKQKKEWENNGFSETNFRVYITKINNKICEIISDIETAELFKITSLRDYGNTSYCINAGKSRIKISY